MTPAIVFDDARGELAPLTDLRPTFDIRTGALTTLERLVRTLDLGPIWLVVPGSLATLAAKRHSSPVNVPPSHDGPVLAINGRCVLPPPRVAGLVLGERLVDQSGELIAARLTPADARLLVQAAAPASPGPATACHEPCLLSRPWHIRTFRDRAIAADLALLVNEPMTDALPQNPPRHSLRADGLTAFGHHRLTIEPTAKVYPGATLDLEQGPIYLDAYAVVRPGAIIIGPAYVGPHSTVLERATIRPNTAIGPWCKVNGEVGGTIFQGYSNKAHDGYLGDSFIGEWVNLGAGTTNSNLLNTYTQVIARARPDGPNERTGEAFLGATIGDHVKTAICTRIMTGAVLHTGSMFATTAPVTGCVPAFTWATDAGTRAFRLDKFLDVARAAMARRRVEPSEAYIAALQHLHQGHARP